MWAVLWGRTERAARTHRLGGILSQLLQDDGLLLSRPPPPGQSRTLTLLPSSSGAAAPGSKQPLKEEGELSGPFLPPLGCRNAGQDALFCCRSDGRFQAPGGSLPADDIGRKAVRTGRKMDPWGAGGGKGLCPEPRLVPKGDDT